MSNGDAITGAISTLTKNKKNLLSHLGTGGGSALVTVLAVHQLLIGPLQAQVDKNQVKADTAVVQTAAIAEQVKGVDKKLDLLIQMQLGARPTTQPAIVDTVKPVIIFVSPSPAVPVGSVVVRGDTTFISTMDTNLVRDTS